MQEKKTGHKHDCVDELIDRIVKDAEEILLGWKELDHDCDFVREIKARGSNLADVAKTLEEISDEIKLKVFDVSEKKCE